MHGNKSIKQFHDKRNLKIKHVSSFHHMFLFSLVSYIEPMQTQVDQMWENRVMCCTIN
jgi:hypothetical protein